MATLIKGGELVLSDGIQAADLLIDGERISRVGVGLVSEGAEVVDASGCLVFPGFIDAHTHLDMPLGETRTADDFETGTKAAVAGGTTTIIDFATQPEGGTLAAGLAEWHERAQGRCRCDYGFHMAVTDWNQETAREIAAMPEEGITSFKAYMAYDALRLNDGEIFALMERVSDIGGLVSCHCENGDLANALSSRYAGGGQECHPLSRPDYIEAEAVSRFCAIGRAADVPVYVVHLSSRAGLEAARAARACGQVVLLETCPQYLTLDASLYKLPDFEGAKYVCAPPLRAQSDREALWEALASGKIDVVATDHCSFNFRGQKELGREDFRRIPGGLPGIEHRASLIYSFGVAQGRITAVRMAQTLAERPAKLFGLYPRKGVLAEGSDADVVIWDKAARGVISNMYQNTDYTPYQGMQLIGAPREVFLRGVLASKNGVVTNAVRGKFIKRGHPEYPRP